MVFVHLVELEGFPPEPISFFLHIYKASFLLGLDSLHTCLFFQVSHVLLDDVHFLLECSQKVLLVLIDYALDVHARILHQKLFSILGEFDHLPQSGHSVACMS